LLESLFGKEDAQEWTRSCKRSVPFFCTILPFPDYNSFFSRTKKRLGRQGDNEVKTRRIWMAVFPYDGKTAGEISLRQRGPFLASQIIDIAQHRSTSTFYPTTFVAGGKELDNSDVDLDLPFISFFDERWAYLSAVELNAKMDRLYVHRGGILP
jgi:hypothetical protein